MTKSPLARGPLGTVWYYAGHGAVRLLAVLLILGLVGFGVWRVVPLVKTKLAPTPTTIVVTQTSTQTQTQVVTETATPTQESTTPTTATATDTPSASVATTPTSVATTKPPAITTKDIPIAFSVKTVQDPTLNKGVRVVRTKGVNGVRRVTYTNGKETSSSVVKQPVTEVVAIGTKVVSKPKQTATKTINCTSNSTITAAASGNVESVTISGPRSSSGKSSAAVSGPAGRYVVTATGSSITLKVDWKGNCSAS